MDSIGIDLGGTNIVAGIVNQNGEILCKEKVPTRNERPSDEIIKDIGLLCRKVMQTGGISQVRSIGIGCPGSIDIKNKRIIKLTNLRFYDVPIEAELRRFMDVPVYVENDANCAALAESVIGAAKNVSSSVTITLGTGVGGGIIIDNMIFNGHNGAASELGHMVIESGGEPCGCGRRGCFESYASATALIRMVRNNIEDHPNSVINDMIGGDVSKINAKVPFDAARQGDAFGIQMVKKYIFWLAEGIINIINMLQPEMIVIGGGVSNEKEYLLAPLRELVYRQMFCIEGLSKTQICAAQTGNDAGIIGAAMLGSL